MKITWSVFDKYIIQLDRPIDVDEFVQNPVEILQPIEVVRGGAKKYIIDFDYSEFDSAKLIGSIPANASIINTVLDVSESFDSGYVTIGTQTAQGILMTVGESNLTFEGMFQRVNFLETESSETYKIFFHGTPTEGVGKITIFYIE